ncbi:esterase/lipase family protein [Haloglomus litoreum]|uniref:esterase/lipase family protein n=1 Tax=Haloglomus litoreum TaxID=3034026 RepID=UPI0023E7AB55|nr:hypothetical protein [Haloglomus sp. DT116]
MTERTEQRDPGSVPDGVDRRRFLRAAAAAGGLATGLGTASADHEEGGRGNPLAGFGGTPCDVPRTSDRYLPFETDGRFGGWGGHEYHVTEPGVRDGQNPVVFVHGNTHDACDFSEHAEAYLDRGYRGDELWSITFRESTSVHAEMARQLDEFVFRLLEHVNGTDDGYDRSGTPWLDAVPEWDVSTVDLVSHSLGVTGVRLWLADRRRYDWPSVSLDADHPAARPRFDRVDTFVGLAGANHGTPTCGPCRTGTGSGEPCNVISPLCADEPGEPLYDLNHYGADCTDPDAPCETNETPRGDRIDYYTIRGTADYFYADDPDSPVLAGAESNVVVDGAHNATRASDTAIELVYQWVTDDGAEARSRPSQPVSGLSGTRQDDGSVLLAGGANTVDLTAAADHPVLLRDRVPYSWTVARESGAVEAVAPRPHEGVKEVYFGTGISRGHDVRYFVEAPEGASSGVSYSFGPAQVRRSGSATWVDVPGTSDRTVVVGPR